MTIRLVGAMLYAGVIPDSRVIHNKYLSPLTFVQEEAIAAFKRDGKIIVRELEPISVLVVLAGTHPESTFRINLNVLIPNADHQSFTYVFPWSAKGFVAHAAELVIRHVTIDGTFDAIPVRVLVNGNPAADLAIPIRLPTD
jgi:hypothetical protein